MRLVREKIHGGDPYADGDFSSVPTELQGWRSRHSVFEAVLKRCRPKTVIEVGVWKGKSVTHMARIAASLEIEGFEILAVDTWLGSPEHWLNEKWRDSMRLSGGYPRIYHVFANNMIAQGLTDIVTPLPVPSETAHFILKDLGARADLIHIDAGHEYESVLADIERFWPILTDSGVIIGDDYLIGAYPGVRQAFVEFAERHGLVLTGMKGKCILSKEDLGPYEDLEVIETLDYRQTK